MDGNTLESLNNPWVLLARRQFFSFDKIYLWVFKYGFQKLNANDMI
jgi:hypothetical protein